LVFKSGSLAGSRIEKISSATLPGDIWVGLSGDPALGCCATLQPANASKAGSRNGIRP
jgi:hypothetical protein